MLTAVQSLAEEQCFSLTSSPWYFGAYISQAQHNLAVALNDLSSKLGSMETATNCNLLNTRAFTILTDPNANPDDVQKAMEYYEKHLPFLFGMHYKFSAYNDRHIPTHNMSASQAGYAAILKQLIHVLHDACNHFSHYTANTEFTVNPHLFYLLNDAFDINTRIVKRRFNLEDAEMHHLRRFIANRDRTLTDKQGKPLRVIPNPAFRYYFNKKDNKVVFTEYGLAFFTCLFLTPAEAYPFLQKIKGFNTDSTRLDKISLAAFCANNLQLPRERLESDYSMEALLPDLCNELARAPGELYETLAPHKQNLFITGDNDGTAVAASHQYIEPENKMIRKNNRFTWFAQRFLDVTNAFPNLRFAVDLGNFHYSIYPKTIAGKEQTRRLTKRLIGYGKLEEFAKDKRPAAYRQLFIHNEAACATSYDPYITDTTPRYYVKNNLIAINYENDSPYWPSLQTAPTHGQKSYPNKYVKEDEKKPLAWLSVFELPALLFYELIQDHISAQQVICNHIAAINKFFNEIKEKKILPVAGTLMSKPTQSEIATRSNAEYNKRWDLLISLLNKYALKPAYIPEKIVNYLLGLTQKNDMVVNEKGAARLQKMIRDCREKIAKLELREKADVKPGKKSFRKIKPGKLAELLVEDMLLMQPLLKNKNGNIPASKANSTACSVLQSHLTYFAQHKNKLGDIFEACRLINSPNAHPFLHTINIEQYAGIADFYKAYFTEKINWLEQCKKEKNYTAYSFLKIKQQPGQNVIKWVDTYLNNNNSSYTACNLPRGLFHDAAMQYFRQSGSPVMKNYVKQFEGNSNTIHLINYYFTKELNDAAQHFYTWPRQYEIFKEPFEINGQNEYYNNDQRTKKWEVVKNVTIRDKNILAQKKQEAEKDIQIFKKEIKTLSDIKAITRYVIEKLGDKYPSVKRIQIIRFKDFEIPRKVIAKVAAFIEDSIKDTESKARAYTFCKENEQYLRLAQAQDQLLFLCVKKLLSDSRNKLQLTNSNGVPVTDLNAFRLKNITAPNEAATNNNILHCIPANGIRITFPYYKVNGKGDFEKEANNRIKAGEATIVDQQAPIKQYGSFKKLIKDRRLNNLCLYFEPDCDGKIVLNKTALEIELKIFEAQRLIVLKKIAEFEKKLFEKNSDQATDLFCSNGRQQHKRYLAFYFTVYSANNEVLQHILTAIRNGFLLNQYPNVTDEQFVVTSETWSHINNSYTLCRPDSTKGYGIIEKIAATAVSQYNSMIHTIDTAA